MLFIGVTHRILPARGALPTKRHTRLLLFFIRGTIPTIFGHVPPVGLFQVVKELAFT